ncbi:hypothetical protein PAZH1_41 [Pseudomonas phage PA_ZH1]|nr:hypothetical protein PAZH1_41 [Pseudomonas phage PA_ZH1]
MKNEIDSLTKIINDLLKEHFTNRKEFITKIGNKRIVVPGALVFFKKLRGEITAKVYAKRKVDGGYHEPAISTVCISNTNVSWGGFSGTPRKEIKDSLTIFTYVAIYDALKNLCNDQSS